MNNKISEAVVRRLPGYCRHLEQLLKEGKQQISSQELGEIMGVTASQIRQDINSIGGMGRQGYGYPIQELRDYIADILDIRRKHTMVILGAGNMGRAVARSDLFAASGFKCVGIFDNSPAKIGWEIGGLTVQDEAELESFLRENPVDIAVITLPMANAQSNAERAAAAGIRGFWNFAPVDLHLPEGCQVVNVHLSDGLDVLSYHLHKEEEENPSQKRAD